MFGFVEDNNPFDSVIIPFTCVSDSEELIDRLELLADKGLIAADGFEIGLNQKDIPNVFNCFFFFLFHHLFPFSPFLILFCFPLKGYDSCRKMFAYARRTMEDILQSNKAKNFSSV